MPIILDVGNGDELVSDSSKKFDKVRQLGVSVVKCLLSTQVMIKGF